MTCAGFEERIARYVGADLAAGDAPELEQHLRVCSCLLYTSRCV